MWTIRQTNKNKQMMEVVNHRREQALSPRPSDGQQVLVIRVKMAETTGAPPAHFTPPRAAARPTTQRLWACGASGTSHTLWAQRLRSHWRRAWQCLWMPSVRQLLYTALALPGTYPRAVEMPGHTDTRRDAHSSFICDGHDKQQARVQPQVPGLVS